MTPRRPLRVCHLGYSFYENDNRIVRYAETLAARGDSVEVIGLRRPDQGRRDLSNGVVVHRIQRRSRGEKAAWTYLLKILWFFLKASAVLAVRGLRRRYDVVHVHNVPDFLVFAAVVPRLLGARLVLDLHDLLPEFYAGKFGTRQDSSVYRALLFIEKVSCRFAHHVIVANHIWQERVAERSADPRRCTPLINYPASQFYRKRGAPEPSAPDTFTLLYPGTLNHHQGLDIAVEAFAEASAAMPGAVFLIYGDGPARQALVAQAEKLGVGDRVQVRDFVPVHEVPSLMAAAQLGVVPKRADGFGDEAFSTKILEFMAGGIPVVVARTRVDRYYFGNGTVRFFEAGDAQDLARQLTWAFEHRDELAAMAASGARYAVELSWERHAGVYLAIVDRLSDRPPADGPDPAAAAHASR